MHTLLKLDLLCGALTCLYLAAHLVATGWERTASATGAVVSLAASVACAAIVSCKLLSYPHKRIKC